MMQALHLMINFIIILKGINTKVARNISFETVFEFKTLSFNTTTKQNASALYEEAYPTAIRLNTKGRLFVSIPRDTNTSQSIPGTFNEIDSNGVLTPWPNETINDYNTGLLQSVVGFEIDLSNNIWLLNHKPTHCEVLVFSVKGDLKANFSLQETTNATSYLSTISLDHKNNFSFIADSQSRDLDEKNFSNLENYGVILLNLKTGVSWRILGRTIPINQQFNDDYYPVNINTVSLRCDNRYLFYSAFLNDQLFSIRTSPLRKNQSIEEGTHFISLKQVMSEDYICSARGHLFFTSEIDREVHEHFFAKEFSLSNIQRLGWFDESSKMKPPALLPMSIAFNGTTGYAFVLMSRFNRNLRRNEAFDQTKVNYGIYKAYVNDRSYLYECNFEEDVSLFSWVVVVALSMILSTTVLYFITFLTSGSSNQPKINENVKGYEETGELMQDEPSDKKMISDNS